MIRVNMFVDKDTELVKESSKKAEVEMAQESSLKIAGEELEQEKEKKQKIDDDQEEVEMKKLIKVVPDEEEVAIDVIPLATKPPSIVDWKIVKEEKISLFQIIRANGCSKRPEEGYERVLWGDLRTMFEHNIEDTVFQDMHLFMLVEKSYPLTPATITEILNKKLQTDHLNEMFSAAGTKVTTVGVKARASHMLGNLSTLQSIPLKILVLKNEVPSGETSESDQCRAPRLHLLQFG
ncbi:hypothetical protein Tco_0759613 [Tanacetum coccineum]